MYCAKHFALLNCFFSACVFNCDECWWKIQQNKWNEYFYWPNCWQYSPQHLLLCFLNKFAGFFDSQFFLVNIWSWLYSRFESRRFYRFRRKVVDYFHTKNKMNMVGCETCQYTISQTIQFEDLLHLFVQWNDHFDFDPQLLPSKWSIKIQ